jgi:hypothetical protein
MLGWQVGTIITWGQSNDTDSDWLAAATLAESTIEAAAPNMLIIVSALCWGLDLRQLAAKPGPAAALNRHKLIFTTHIYTFSFWWMQVRNRNGSKPYSSAATTLASHLCSFLFPDALCLSPISLLSFNIISPWNDICLPFCKYYHVHEFPILRIYFHDL